MPDEVLLTAADLARRLNCSERTVRRMRLAGHLPPAVRLGKLVRWQPQAIERWIAQRLEPAAGH
jgi:excisionase family DNA binding protein